MKCTNTHIQAYISVCVCVNKITSIIQNQLLELLESRKARPILAFCGSLWYIPALYGPGFWFPPLCCLLFYGPLSCVCVCVCVSPPKKRGKRSGWRGVTTRISLIWGWSVTLCHPEIWSAKPVVMDTSWEKKPFPGGRGGAEGGPGGRVKTLFSMQNSRMEYAEFT